MQQVTLTRRVCEPPAFRERSERGTTTSLGFCVARPKIRSKMVEILKNVTYWSTCIIKSELIL